jgi:hypothetical protein
MVHFMARIITGVLLLAWGLALLVSGLFRDYDTSTAYGTGQFLGWVFGAVLVALGVRAIVKGREARHQR